MLAATPAFGAPAATTGMAMDHATMATSAADHAAHAIADDCCSTQTPHGQAAMGGDCHCAVTCVSVLPALAFGDWTLAMPDAMPVSRHGAVAPRVAFSPPLRPPLQLTTDLS